MSSTARAATASLAVLGRRVKLQSCLSRSSLPPNARRRPPPPTSSPRWATRPRQPRRGPRRERWARVRKGRHGRKSHRHQAPLRCRRPNPSTSRRTACERSSLTCASFLAGTATCLTLSGSQVRLPELREGAMAGPNGSRHVSLSPCSPRLTNS